MKNSAIRSALLLTTCLAIAAGSPAFAGEFDGISIDAKLGFVEIQDSHLA